MGRGTLAAIDLSADAVALAASVERWLGANTPAPWATAVAEGAAKNLLDAAGRDAYGSWYEAVARSGVVVPRWPARANGLELDNERAAAVDRVLQARGVVRPGAFELARIGPAIAMWGDDEQIAHHLEGILLGRVQWCQLFSEPNAGSDLPSLSTTATRDGDHWVVRGQKVWTSGADTAPWGLLLARTSAHLPKRDGLTCFLLDMALPGVEVRPLRQLTGDASFSEVFLDDVLLPDAARLGPVDGGWTTARTVLAGERRGISGAGAGEAMDFDITVDERPLRALDGGRDDAVRLYVLGKVQAWRNQRLRGAPAALASLSKIAQSELNQFGHQHIVSVMGMRAVACQPDDVEALDARYGFLRSRANTIEGGTSEIHRDVVAEQHLGLPRTPDPYHRVSWKDVPR
jgi:alkylation response protein AidB-like acyl-CoA dehydrogenase